MADGAEGGGLGPLDEALRLRARQWARQARRVGLAILLAAVAAGAAAAALIMNLR